jgi:hypothetical protein
MPARRTPSSRENILCVTGPSIDQLFDKVLAIPGVDAVAKPAIEALRAKLDALSKA